MGYEPPPGTWIPLLNKNPAPNDPDFSITALGLRILLLLDDKRTVTELCDLMEQPEETLLQELNELEQQDYLTLHRPEPPVEDDLEAPATEPGNVGVPSATSLESLVAQLAADPESQEDLTGSASLFSYSATAKAESTRGTAQVAFASVPVQQSEMTREEAEKLSTRKQTTKELRSFSMSDYLDPEARDEMLTQSHTPAPKSHRPSSVESIELDAVKISSPSQQGLPHTPVPQSSQASLDLEASNLEEYTMDDLEIVSFEEDEESFAPPPTETEELEVVELDSVILTVDEEALEALTEEPSKPEAPQEPTVETLPLDDVLVEDLQPETLQQEALHVETPVQATPLPSAPDTEIEQIEEVELDAVILTEEDEKHSMETDSLLQELLAISDPLDEP